MAAAGPRIFAPRTGNAKSSRFSGVHNPARFLPCSLPGRDLLPGSARDAIPARLAGDRNAHCGDRPTFEISDPHREAAERALKKREGPSFNFRTLPVRLPEGRTVLAVTPLNDRTKITYIGHVPIAAAERAAMARVAKGTEGRCADYVRNISKRLDHLGIADLAVTEFAALLDRE